MPPRFTHLRMHTEYSILDSTIRIPNAIELAQQDRQGALAITDLCNLFGFIKFYQKCRRAGIKPIAGCDFFVRNNLHNTPTRLLFLCRNMAGYRTLCELITKAYIEQQGPIPILEMDWLTPEFTQHLIILSGGHTGAITAHLLQGNEKEALNTARTYAQRFPQRFYLELHAAAFPKQTYIEQATIHIAQQLSLPLVATHPIQFLRPEHYYVHQARVCIAEGNTLSQASAQQHFTKEQYFYTQEQMSKAFAHIPSALTHSVEIAQQCNLFIPLHKPQPPIFPIPADDTHEEYLQRSATQGLAAKLTQLYPDQAERAPIESAYWSRFETELRTIHTMGFASYFLIVADFIQWAKKNHIPVGPGRGSGAGSLVAYALDITQLDPLKYDLLFERFLNPERVSMPDFDIDFCQDKRHLVIDYVKEKYGADAVSQIVTFGTMAAKAAIRDIGRVLSLPYAFVDGLAKMIPMELGITIAQAKQSEPALQERENTEEEVKHCLALAEEIEGIVRNVGTHAGGVLIAPTTLTAFCPLYLSSHTEGIVSQYDKDDIEAIGLIKFDFLGLRTLTIIDRTLALIRSAQGEQAPLLDERHFDDKDSYALLASANTTGVFQLESRGMRELLKKIQPSTFEDIIAILALYRPGPLGSGMVDDFIHRKRGKTEVTYVHPVLEPILHNTYGVIIYQEQVMLIAQRIGGYSLGKADLLRRAMGKKKAEEMAQHRSIFRKGAVEQGYEATLADHLFDLMEKFAEYGFNKSHTAAYAVLSYQTAWLKTHYPAYFMAATLSSEIDDTEKLYYFYQDCLANDIEVLAPCVNHSSVDFWPATARSILYGLCAIRGVGKNAAQHIVHTRQQHGPFQNLSDFCRAVQLSIVNKRTLEALIKSGACDIWQEPRDLLLAALPRIIEQTQHHHQHAAQTNLFDIMTISALSEAASPTHARWTPHQKLQEEKQALGFYMSAHPFDLYYESIRDSLIPGQLDQLHAGKESQWLCGMISQIRKNNTKRGTMAFIRIEDGHTSIELAFFSEQYERYKHLCQIDHFLIAHGRIQKDEYHNQLRMTVDQAFSEEDFRLKQARSLICLTQSSHDIPALHRLIKEAHNTEATCTLLFEHHCAGMRCILRDPRDPWRIHPTNDLLKKIGALSMTTRLLWKTLGR